MWHQINRHATVLWLSWKNSVSEISHITVFQCLLLSQYGGYDPWLSPRRSGFSFSVKHGSTGKKLVLHQERNWSFYLKQIPITKSKSSAPLKISSSVILNVTIVPLSFLTYHGLESHLIAEKVAWYTKYETIKYVSFSIAYKNSHAILNLSISYSNNILIPSTFFN